MSRVFTVPTNGIASADKYHPLTKDHMVALKEMAQHAEDNGGIGPQDLLDNASWLQAMEDCVICHAPGIYSVAYLHPRYCSAIIHEVSKFEHVVNDEEPEVAQIPEVVLQTAHPVFYEVFRSFWHDLGLTYCRLLLNMAPENLRT
ncbi:MAG: hypothetical protein ACOH2R_17285, partial [Pseudomonas sp.]